MPILRPAVCDRSVIKFSVPLFWLALIMLAALRFTTWFDAISAPLPACSSGDIRLSGGVQELAWLEGNSHNPPSARFILKVSASETCGELISQRFRMYWRDAPPSMTSASTVTAVARLRKAWGSVNPGVFDYELWLYGKRLRGTGYIRSGTATISVQDKTGRVATPTLLVHEGVLRAVALGERSSVDADTWALLRDTGTVHLMVVSGLHVGILAGATYLLLIGVLRLMPGNFWFLSRRHMAMIFAWLVVCGFIYQAGFQAPLVRAGLMLSAGLFFLLALRKGSWLNLLVGAGLVALLFSPNSLLQVGFWLSHLGVACLLIYFGNLVRQYGWLRSLVAAQVIMFLGLSPWLGWLVGQVPLVSPFANLIAAPLISLACVPFAMYGFFLQQIGLFELGRMLLVIADFTMHLTLNFLLFMKTSAIPHSGFWPSASAYLGGGVFLCWCKRQSYREITACMILFGAIHLQKFASVTPGEFRIQVLDVGQGNAAILDTAHHRLLIDTGPRYSSGYNAGEATVLPVLRRSGPKRLDRMLVSHFDMDHAGGMPALIERFPQVKISSPDQSCESGGTWQWDGVKFTTLIAADQTSRNEASCTLLVTSDKATAYFSGDIGTRTERILMQFLPPQIDFLMAPHHGSSGSSHRGFIRYLRPRWVVFSAGLNNRYGHPKKSVVDLYRHYGGSSLTTALTGGLIFESADPSSMFLARPRGFSAFYRVDEGLVGVSHQ